jgi:hypothetical protein
MKTNTESKYQNHRQALGYEAEWQITSFLTPIPSPPTIPQIHSTTIGEPSTIPLFQYH